MGSKVNVVLTLTALDGNLSIAERRITLNSKNNAIPVGRASKSVTKGLLEAPNNTWFDSPVMSRNHATIELNSENMTVTIKDIGSMHGTYLNDIELPKHTPTVINDNDVLVFGAEVRRGAEVFPACSFKTTSHSIFNKPHTKSANTYTFPESDIEEDGYETHDYFSEDDLGVDDSENRYTSEDDVSIELAAMKTSKASDTIDLTGDDFPHLSMSNHVDLTRQTSVAQGLDMLSPRAADVGESADQNSIAVYAGNHSIVLDSEDESLNEDADYSSKSDDQEEGIASRDSDRARIHAILEDDSETGDSQIEDSVDNTDVDSDAEMESEDPSAPKPVTISGLARYALANDVNPVIHLPDVRTRQELPDSDEEDDDSEFSLDEAGAEGLKALYSAGSSLPDPEWEDENETGVAQSYDLAIQNSLNIAPFLDSSSSSISKNVPEARSEVQEGFWRPFSMARQPSPSDAAMAKSAVVPRKISICDLGQADDYSPQALGEKSGKPDFFAAREVNKARFGSGELDRNTFEATNRTAHVFSVPSVSRKDPAIALSGAAAAKVTRGMTDSAEASIGTSATESWEPVSMYSGVANMVFAGNTSESSHIPTRDYCLFLDKPDESLGADRAPSPLPDMTSSHTYNTSKNAMKTVSDQLPSSRSAIKINDIVESSLSNNTNKLKRKLDSISEDLRDWASSNVSSDASGASSSILVQRVAARSSGIEAPAAKRLKKLLSNVGYVALGGAALFATLVATAPDLM
ncbi:hypothetical protein WAI453_005832 [Rhynchosporium graminicola]|uniref:FHA domain-containing protein n=1 Tax=Rhynchosporium graminicola TaxID=2792576 RepID=A0A1E1KK39_9HELO|nr:uncharacterized protein RCO7_04205 [Rhynchosporium commune]